MSLTKAKSIHEKYHNSTKKQLKIIKLKNFTYRLVLGYLDKYIGDESKKRVLDIGCGAGSISFYLASKGHSVTGIDISIKAIEECRQSAKQLKLKNVVFKQSYFPEDFKLGKKYDAVVFTEVIEHLEKDDLALNNINQLLKGGGFLILSTPSLNAPLHRLGLTNKFDKEVGHLRRYTFSQLKELLRKNNFKLVESKETEGIVRNFLFVNPYAGKLVRYVNFFASDLVTFIDNISLKLFGNSNFIIVARKK